MTVHRGTIDARQRVFSTDSLSWEAQSTVTGGGGAGSTQVAVSSVAGVVHTAPSDTNWASSAGFHFDGSGSLLTASGAVAPSTQVSVSSVAGIVTTTPSAGSTQATRPLQSSAADLQMTATPAAGSTWAVNVSQFGAVAVVTGVGAAGSGVPRVTVSNDNVETTGTINTPAQTFQVAVAGMTGAGVEIAAGTLATTLTFQYSADNASTWSTAGTVINGVQNFTTLTLTNPNAVQAVHYIMGEHWTHVRVLVGGSVSGSAGINIRTTKLTSPLAVGAISCGFVGFAPPFWVTNIGGSDGSLTRAGKFVTTPASTDFGLVTRSLLYDSTGLSLESSTRAVGTNSTMRGVAVRQMLPDCTVASGRTASAGDNTIISSAAGVGIYVYALSISPGLVSTAAQLTRFLNGSTSEVWRYNVVGGGSSVADVGAWGQTLAVSPPAYLFRTAAANNLVLNTTSSGVSFSVAAWKE